LKSVFKSSQNAALLIPKRIQQDKQKKRSNQKKREEEERSPFGPLGPFLSSPIRPTPSPPTCYLAYLLPHLYGMVIPMAT
jgi:hypothetical protein